MSNPPETEPERPEPAAPAVAPAAATPPAPMTGGRVALIVAGSLVTLFALCVVAVGAYGMWLYATQRTDGYVMTSSERFETGAYALATRTLEVSSDVPSFLYGSDWLGDVRIRGESADPARPLFIGIARRSDVDRYLAGVAHAEVVDIDSQPLGTSYKPRYRARPGDRPGVAPERARFWVARASGPGAQELTWSVESGRWAVVVMRPDGSRGVSADLAAGAELPALLWVSIVALAFGLLSIGGGGVLIYLGAREPRGRRPPVA